jgi:hypothetical protein
MRGKDIDERGISFAITSLAGNRSEVEWVDQPCVGQTEDSKDERAFWMKE